MTHVYKGEISNQLIVGIDMFDVGWAEEFQEENRKFLLFLEESEEADFLVPVGEPNGMIQILAGKVHNHNDVNTIYYEEFLTSQQPISTSVGNSEAPSQDKKQLSTTLLYTSVLVVVGILLYLFIRLRKKK